MSKNQRKMWSKTKKVEHAAVTEEPASSRLSIPHNPLFLWTRQRKPTRVAQQQKTPSGFLKLPAEVFTMVVLYLELLDLIYLAQVNTSIRKLLMHRSASSIWRTCIENAGLPACPVELSEPRYASVLYLPICSACGLKKIHKFDNYLLVRLCQPCSEQILVDWRTIEPTELQALMLASTQSCYSSIEQVHGLKHSLKQEVEYVKTRLCELRSSGTEETLQTWIQSRKEDLEMRKERRDLLLKYFQTTHLNKLNEWKTDWREQVGLRVLALGYNVKEEDLPVQKREVWRGFFDRTDLFTETKWNDLKHHIVDFLETEAKECSGSKSGATAT
ncbi:hypothetical protein FRC09_002136 [Ceratobasidium sp. 395]|nr:hypothetical protein FRC09_002136 [Ceratobasidium sp. 395]